jgi:hypothetical protein
LGYTRVIPYNDIDPSLKQLNIGKTNKSVYYKYQVNPANLHLEFIKYHGISEVFPYEACMRPVAANQILAYEFEKLRTSHLPFITFHKPRYDNSHVDFHVNDFKIQEKTASRRNRKTGYIADIRRTFNKRSQDYPSYDEGMNDFYWINLLDRKIFYIIPEKELIDRGFVYSQNITIDKRSALYISESNDNWYTKYKFNYDNPDEERLKNCLVSNKLIDKNYKLIL